MAQSLLTRGVGHFRNSAFCEREELLLALSF